jgi:GT2 family glycosyltransferase
MTRTQHVVVVAYGAADALDNALAGLAPAVEVTVVDNSSSEAVRAAAKRHRANYVDAEANLGFGAGANVALRRLLPGEPRDVVLLNPDAVLNPRDLETMVCFLNRPENKRVAAVAPRLVSDDGSEQRVVWPFPTPARAWAIAVGLGDLPARRTFVVGTVLLLRWEALQDVGLFDERFFLYAEETDWQRRAAERGWASAVCREAVAVHAGAGTSEDPLRRESLFHAAQETYVRKWHGSLGWAVYRAAALLGALARSVVLTGERRTRAAQRATLYARGPRSRLRWDGNSRKPSVVHVVTTDRFAGAERYVSEVARETAARGWETAVVGGDPMRMPQALGAEVRWRPGATPLRAVWSLAVLGRHDVCHAHMTLAEAAALAARPFHRAPVISTRHFGAPRGSTRAGRLAAKWIGPRLAREIAVSDFVARHLERPPDAVIHNGVAPQQLLWRPENRVVLVLQRLEPEKDTATALRAWQLSDLASAGWRLRVVGDGAERRPLEQLVADERIEGVDFAGRTSDVASEFARAGILLSPGPVEGFGLAVVEAMAAGVPVVGSAAGGHFETVGELPKARLFPPGDLLAAAEALRSLRADDLRAELSVSGRALAERLFTITRHVDALIGEYELAIQANCGAHARTTEATP